MKKIFIPMLVFLLFSSAGYFAQITNTANITADMSELIAAGFNPEVDSIMVQGLVWGEGLSDDDLSGSRTLLPDPSNPSLFKTTLVVTVPTASGLTIGDSVRWKLMAWPAGHFENWGWESDFDPAYDGYPLIIQSDGSVIDIGPFLPKIKMAAPVITRGGPHNTLHIKLDLSSIYGSGLGYFDPTVDYVRVEGFTWDDESLLISDDTARIMKRNPFEPGIIYEATIVVELDTAKVIGDSLRWKFKGCPDPRFGNLGWEGSNGRYYVFQEDETVAELGPYTPYFFPLGPELEYDVDILFQLDMNLNPQNYYDGSLIPVGDI